MVSKLSIKTRTYLLTLLLICLASTGTFTLQMLQSWYNLEEKQFELNASLTRLLDTQLSHFNQLIPPDHPKDSFQQVDTINQILQPHVETLLSAFPDHGAGYYSKQHNSIVAYGPNYSPDGLKDIRQESKARTVYTSKTDYRYSAFSQTRQSQVIAIIRPLIRNNEVIGHVWANVAIQDFRQMFFHELEKQVPFFIIVILLGIAGTYLVTSDFQKSLSLFLHRVRNRDLNEDSSRQFSGELLKIYSEVVRSYQQVSRSEKRLRDVILAFDETVWESDTEGQYTYLSREDQRRYRHQSIPESTQLVRHSYVGRSCFEYIIEQDLEPTRAAFMNALKEGHSFHDLEFRCANSKGEIRWYKSSAVPIKSDEGLVVGMRGATRDITLSKQQEEQIRHLAYHDTLTGLPNRLDFMQILASLVSHQKTAAVFFIDIDRFKTLNDSLGHPFGDEVLKVVSHRLSYQLPAKSVLSRFGGDEFLLAVPGYDQPAAESLASQLVSSFHSHPLTIKKRQVNITISIGIAISPLHGDNSEQLVQNADVALYQTKHAGRDGYSCCHPEMTEQARQKLELEQDMRQAIQEDQFFLLYQPQVDPETGQVIGVESLIRWMHPEKGTIPPFRFIPLAEETQQIIAIGHWVLKEACYQAKKWLDAGHPVRMAVNVSSIQFNQDDFVEEVASVLQETQLPPEWLELEITESVAVKHLDWVKKRLDALKALGVSLALDDFGTGFSSLSYLQQFPIDKLKIDRSFVVDICEHKEDAFMIDAILHMAKGLGMKVVAEGVEEQAQLKFLAERRCQLIQGYFFSPPVDSTSCKDLIQKGYTPSETADHAASHSS